MGNDTKTFCIGTKVYNVDLTIVDGSLVPEVTRLYRENGVNHAEEIEYIFRDSGRPQFCRIQLEISERRVFVEYYYADLEHYAITMAYIEVPEVPCKLLLD